MTKPRKPRGPITPKFAPAFEMLCHGVPPLMVAKTTGYSERQIRRVLAKPEVKALMISVARDTVARATPKAAIRLTQLMEQDDSKKVSLEASQYILGTAGIRPPPASAVPAVNIGIGVMPSRHVLTPEMSDQEVKEIEREWAAYRGPGYLIDWRGDRRPEIEHVPNGAADA